MNSFTTETFRRGFAGLRPETQRLARKAYLLWQENPRHPSVQFKKVGALWSARIDRNHRALATMRDGDVYWIWIGSHAEYEELIQRQRGDK